MKYLRAISETAKSISTPAAVIFAVGVVVVSALLVVAAVRAAQGEIAEANATAELSLRAGTFAYLTGGAADIADKITITKER